MDVSVPTELVSNPAGPRPTTTNNRWSTVDKNDAQEVIEAQVSRGGNSPRPTTRINLISRHSNARSSLSPRKKSSRRSNARRVKKEDSTDTDSITNDDQEDPNDGEE